MEDIESRVAKINAALLAKGYEWNCVEIGWKALCGYGTTVWISAQVGMPDGTHKHLGDRFVEGGIPGMLANLEAATAELLPFADVEARAVAAYTALTPEQRDFIPRDQRRELDQRLKGKEDGAKNG